MSFVEPVGFKLNSRVKAFLERIDENPFHMHEDVIEILCVVKGEFHISESAQDYTLIPGDVYIFNAKDPHKIQAASKDAALITLHIQTKYYETKFGVDIFPYFICDSFLQHTPYSVDTRHLRFLITRILIEYLKDAPSDITMEEYTTQLLEYLLEQHKAYLFVKTNNGQIRMMRKPNIGKKSRDDERIYAIIDYIYAHFTENITLEEIANKEYLSLGYLSRYIKNASGLTFSEHVSLARCEEVERLLGNTSKTIDQIAMDVGFANRNHLATQFKKWFKKTPSEYRKSIDADLAKVAMANYVPVEYNEVKEIINRFLDEK